MVVGEDKNKVAIVLSICEESEIQFPRLQT